MDFAFTPEQEAWRRVVRAFFEATVADDLRRRAEEDGTEFDEGLYQAIARAGYLGIAIPRAYGGQGRSYTELAIFSEEAARAGVPHGVTSLFGGSAYFAAIAVVRLGTEEQKRIYLPRIISGDYRFTQGYTEPGCGSDLAAVQTRAEPDGDDLVVSGEKIFNSGHLASHMIAVVRTDPAVPRHRGISLVVVDLRAAGVSVTPLITLRGWRRNSVLLDRVRVPRALGLLGELNRGWGYVMSIMDLERAGVGFPAEMEATLRAVVDYVRTACRDGRPLASYPEVRRALADMHRIATVGRLLSWQVVWLQEQGEDTSWRASYQKLYNGEALERIANLAADVAGPRAALEWANASPAARRWSALEGLLSRLYKDSRVMQIAGGTSEIQRTIIAQRGLGLPRD